MNNVNDMNIVWLNDVNSGDVSLVGGKGASLGEMINIGLPVPGGFAVTATAFRRFLDETQIADKLFKFLEVNVDHDKELKKAEKEAKGLVLSTEMTDDIYKDIISAYKDLCKQEGKEVFVAVRSSATAEDLPGASFAGQQETFLNISGAEDVVLAVKKCWASLYEGRAIFYREKQGFDHSSVDISVIVQVLVDAKKAGVMFTSHPSTGEPKTIIEAAWGLGESVVSGGVSPDNYVINNKAKKIIEKVISSKEVMHIRDENGGVIKEAVPEERKEKQVLLENEILNLTEIGQIIEEHYGAPQDVEWVINGNKIYIVQSRPITTINNASESGVGASEESPEEIILEGIGASPGIGSGGVKIINDISELDKALEGDILVTKMTTPDMVPAMRRVAGIITNEGGLTCHAAIVSRELGTPAVVGTKKATKILEDGMVVTINGKRGIVYKGIIKKAAPSEDADQVVATRQKIITATEVKVNIDFPDLADKAAATGADGVGLLRVEHMILSLKKHPNAFIKEGKSAEYIGALTKDIGEVAEAFYPKPVWVRTLDAPTDEFRSMEGGIDEPEEDNPMLGWRGIRRDLTDVEHFRMELRAFKNLFDKGLTNVGIMLPLVQHPSELRQAKRIMVEEGLKIGTFDLGIMVETPGCALTIEDFIEEGLDFISFGTNDLTQYTLAVDRNNGNIAHLYNEQHKGVLKLIEYVIQKCKRAGVKTSICGQAGSSPEMARKLVEFGIDSISSNIDAVSDVRESVARAEQRMILDSVRNNGPDAI